MLLLLLLQTKHGSEPPVPLAPGEVLLYECGWPTRKNVVGSMFGATVIWAYVALNAKLYYFNPDIALLTGNQLAAFTGFAGLATIVFGSASRAAIRYAVLTADGLSLRLYPYASGWGPLGGEPVTIPIPMLSIAERTAGAVSGGAGNPNRGGGGRADNGSVYVDVRGSNANLVFDKPASILPWVGGPGTGLVMSAKGVSGTNPDPAGNAAAALAIAGAGAASPVASLQMLYSLPTADREAIRRYALLVHCLSGRTVDPARLRDDVSGGGWELEDMTSQLDPATSGTGRKPAAARITELRFWRRAVDRDSGRSYWWHTITGNTQWTPPLIEGKSPYEWHPDLALAEAAEKEGSK